MGARNDDRHPSADEVVLLRRRVAELERANERLRAQVCRTGGPRYQDLLDNMNDIIYTTDRAGTLLSINQAVKRVLGFAPQEVLGTHYSRWMPKEEFDKLEAARPDTLKGQRTTKQIVMNDKEGNEQHVELSVSPLIVDGRIEGTQGIIRDITARHQAEQAARRGQEMLRALFNAATESIFLLDRQGTVLMLNETAARRFGKSPEELIGRRIADVGESLFPASTVEYRTRRISEVLRTGQAVRFEDERAGRFFDTSAYPVFDEQGTVQQIAVFGKDITERKQLERKLGESEERYRMVVESAGETIAIVDAQGVFQFLNTTAGRRLGGPPTDFVGKTMWELFPQEIADRQMGTIRKVIQTRTGVNTIVSTYVGGKHRWYNTTVEPCKDGAGQVTAALIVARDIHELKTAQQELETYREKMMRTEHLALLGTVSAMLSHEMTQPLTVIRLSIQNAMKSLESASPPPTVLDDLKDGLAGVSHVTAILHRLRDFTGRSSDKVADEISLSAVAHRIVRLLEESARKARIALRVHQLDELPPVRMCGKEVEQIFFALTQNAIQAADGVRDHCLQILGARRDGHVELRFADDCGGIDPKVLGHIFEPFFTTKPAGEGTGLGLCVVERIVSQAGGRLQVDSEWGKGTTFFVTLPIEPI